MAIAVEPTTAQPAASHTAGNSSGSETIKLDTKDGVELFCQFYEGKPSTQTVPVILIHELKGQSGEWAATAKTLQAAGHSVIVPDLRGHGESTEQTLPTGGAARKLKAERLRADDFKKMVTMDLEAVKKFLLQKHNNEELNIDMLTVAGSEFGATIGALWTAQDWTWPLVAGQKQGQDVKALVMLSPRMTYKGLNMAPATKSRAFGEIAVFVVYGQTGKQGGETRRLYKIVERAQQDRAKPRTFEWAIETNLQGAKLLQEKNLKVAETISKFINAQIVDRADDFPYKKRERTN